DRDIACLDAETFRRERVPKLVENDATEDRKHEQHAVERRPRIVARRLVVDPGEPKEEEEKGPVDEDLDPRDLEWSQRPSHCRVSPESRSSIPRVERRSYPAKSMPRERTAATSGRY